VANSSVDVVIGSWQGDRVRSRAEARNFLRVRSVRTGPGALGPTQSIIHWVLRTLPSEVPTCLYRVSRARIMGATPPLSLSPDGVVLTD
jgi:hypothetical protein